MAVAVAAQRRAQLLRGRVDRRGRVVLQPLQVGGHLAAQRLDDAAGRDVADALEPLQVARRRERGDLVGVAAARATVAPRNARTR